MKRITSIGGSFPKAIRAIVRLFADDKNWQYQVWECTPQEMLEMEDTNLIHQLIYAKEYKKFFWVAVGEKDRPLSYLIYTPELVTETEVFFAYVDDAWVRKLRSDADVSTRWRNKRKALDQDVIPGIDERTGEYSFRGDDWLG